MLLFQNGSWYASYLFGGLQADYCRKMSGRPPGRVDNTFLIWIRGANGPHWDYIGPCGKFYFTDFEILHESIRRISLSDSPTFQFLWKSLSMHWTKFNCVLWIFILINFCLFLFEKLLEKHRFLFVFYRTYHYKVS